jgi:hypothetical protein
VPGHTQNIDQCCKISVGIDIQPVDAVGRAAHALVSSRARRPMLVVSCSLSTTFVDKRTITQHAAENRDLRHKRGFEPEIVFRPGVSLMQTGGGVPYFDFPYHPKHLTRPTIMSPAQKHQNTGGDDLDDGLELDPGLLAESDDEDGGSVNVEDLLEMTDEEDKGPKVSGQKRKAHEEDDEDDDESMDEDAKKADKKKRRKEKDKERRAKVCLVLVEKRVVNV